MAYTHNKPEEVQDRPTEAGIRLQNILTFLVLAVMSWVGYNIEQMKQEMSTLHVASAVQAAQVAELKERFERHLKRYPENHPWRDWNEFKRTPPNGGP